MIITANNKGQFKRKAMQLAESLEYPVFAEIQHGDIRTVESNAYYWGVVVKSILRKLNDDGYSYSATAIHEFLKIERFGKRIVQIGKQVQEVCARSSKMTSRQFNDFVQWAEAYAINDLEVPGEYFVNDVQG